MSDTKLLQTILDNQQSLNTKIDSGFYQVKEELRSIKKRLDVIGKSVAYLEDDAPTREEYDELVDRVKNLENQLTAAS